MNERFFWTNDYTEQSFTEKMNYIFHNEQNQFLLAIEKKSNEMDLSRTMNSRNEKGTIAPISKPGSGVYMKDLDLEFDKITLIVTNKE